MELPTLSCLDCDSQLIAKKKKHEYKIIRYFEGERHHIQITAIIVLFYY